MRNFSTLIAVALAGAMTATAFAQPRVISNLSDGALMGELQSTAQLQNEFSNNAPLLADATVRLGLTQEEFTAVRRAVINGGARYVELPRHLDGMSGSRNRHAFAVRDVVIPARVYGWEVDLQKPTEVVRVFIPNKCGNISYLRVPKRQAIAAVAPYHEVAASTPAPIATEAPLPLETPAPAPTPAAVAFVPVAPVAVAAAHHLAIIPWLLGLGVAAVITHHGGGVNTYSPPGLIKAPVPTPIVTICPT